MAPLPLCFSQCVSISRYPISCLSYRPLFSKFNAFKKPTQAFFRNSSHRRYICSPPGGSGPKELYYAPANRCYREGQRGPCKANQTLYEGQIPGHGICDCAPKLGLIYSSYDDECYIQNVQVSLSVNSWK